MIARRNMKKIMGNMSKEYAANSKFAAHKIHKNVVPINIATI